MISVIFVEPESAGNIGSIARCMKNFGASQLILVNPCSLQGARKMAMHAADILESAITVTTLSAALEMVDTSLATTSTVSGLHRKAVSCRNLKITTGHIGIVIGRESSGLTNEEIKQCDFVVFIPASEEYPVLNAASACCILLYELCTCLHQPVYGAAQQRERILQECEKIAHITERRTHRKRIWNLVLKRVLSKAFLTDRETTVLLGFFRRVRTFLESKP